MRWCKHANQVVPQAFVCFRDLVKLAADEARGLFAIRVKRHLHLYEGLGRDHFLLSQQTVPSGTKRSAGRAEP